MILRGEWANPELPDQKVYHPAQAVNYGSGANPLQQMYWWVPREGTDFSAVIWFHGGGLTMDGREVAECFFDGRTVVIEARYRISPEFPAPAAIADTAAAIARVLKDAEQYGINPARISIGGMSAGAYLAALVGMDGSYLAAYGFDHRSLEALLIISGQMTTHFQLKTDLHYPQSQFQPVVDRFAPLWHLSAELPPILLLTGESDKDIPGRPEENALTAASLRVLGHPLVRCYHLDGCDHGGAYEHSEPYIVAFRKEVEALRK